MSLTRTKNLIEKQLNEKENCTVNIVYAGGNGLQSAYRILAKVAIEKAAAHKTKEKAKTKEG